MQAGMPLFKSQNDLQYLIIWNTFVVPRKVQNTRLLFVT